MAVFGFLLAAAAILPATLTTDPYACVWYTCFAVFGLEVTVGVSWAIPLDIGGDFAGSVAAVMNTAGNIGGAISPARLAYLVQAYGWNVPFFVAAALSIAAAALFLKIDATRRIHGSEGTEMRINSSKCVACGNCTYVCPMGAIYIDPVIKRATVDRNECVECYSCFNGMSQEHLNPTMVRTMRKVFQMMRLRFDPGAGRLSHRRVRAGRAGLAARGAAGIFRSARTARIHRRAGPRHRRGQDQRRQRPRQARRSRLHHRVRTAGRRRLVPRDPEDDVGAGRRRRLREEKR